MYPIAMMKIYEVVGVIEFAVKTYRFVNIEKVSGKYTVVRIFSIAL